MPAQRWQCETCETSWNQFRHTGAIWCRSLQLTLFGSFVVHHGVAWCSSLFFSVALAGTSGRPSLSISFDKVGFKVQRSAQNGCFSSNYIPTCQFFPLSQSQDVSSWRLLAGPSAEHNQDVSDCQNKSICLKVAGCWGSLSKRKLWIWIYLDWRFLFSFNQSRQQEGDTPVDSKDWDANSEGASLSSILSTVLYIASWFRHVPMSSTIAAQYIYIYVYTYIHAYIHI